MTSVTLCFVDYVSVSVSVRVSRSRHCTARVKRLSACICGVQILPVRLRARRAPVACGRRGHPRQLLRRVASVPGQVRRMVPRRTICTVLRLRDKRSSNKNLVSVRERRRSWTLDAASTDAEFLLCRHQVQDPRQQTTCKLLLASLKFFTLCCKFHVPHTTAAARNHSGPDTRSAKRSNRDRPSQRRTDTCIAA